ncbi:Uncharacterized protein DBV15_07554 [Temnothorax longispinosus]|uniref:Uncharacterized protein n=1 Tax=Temnothorax longispinosus TaxID=300112 RepID=A0A4S2KX78_9HYME|nr:Uncharacterized protein DBV15_07554 [Temnothorax longispinosus]
MSVINFYLGLIASAIASFIHAKWRQRALKLFENTERRDKTFSKDDSLITDIYRDHDARKARDALAALRRKKERQTKLHHWLAAKLTVDFDASHTGIPESMTDWELVNVRDHRILCSVMVERLSMVKSTHKILAKHVGGWIGKERFLSCLFLIPPQLNPKVKLSRLAIHYSRLTCRNYFADGKLPLKRQLESHKYAMRAAGLGVPPKTVPRPMPNDHKNYWLKNISKQVSIYLRPNSLIRPFHHSTGPELPAVWLISGCKSLNPRLNRRADWRAGREGTVVPLSLTYRVNKPSYNSYYCSAGGDTAKSSRACCGRAYKLAINASQTPRGRLQPPGPSTRAALEKDDFTTSYRGNTTLRVARKHHRFRQENGSGMTLQNFSKVKQRAPREQIPFWCGNVISTVASGIENRRREITGRGKRQKSAAFFERCDDVTFARSPRPYNRERAGLPTALLKLVTPTNKNDVSGGYYLAPMSRSDTNERWMRMLIKRSEDKLDLPLEIERAIRPSTRRRGIWTVHHLSMPEHVPPPGSPPRSCRSAVDAPAASLSCLCGNVCGTVACGQCHLHLIAPYDRT